MEIKTKHNIDDVVYLMNNNSIITAEVKSIDINIQYGNGYGNKITIKYLIRKDGATMNTEVYEGVLYVNKQDLLDSL